MTKATKIAISLPEDLLETIEKERRQSGETRSQFFRRAVQDFVRKKRESRDIDQYIRGYQKYPETKEDIAIAELSSQQALDENPWAVEDPTLAAPADPQAVAQPIKEQEDAALRVLYVSAEQFTNDFVQSIQERKMKDFRIMSPQEAALCEAIIAEQQKLLMQLYRKAMDAAKEVAER